MAMTSCRECGKPVSTTAKACPHCGAGLGPDAHTKAGTTVLTLIGIVVAVVLVGRCASSTSPSKPAVAPEDPAAAKERAMETARFDLAYDVAKAVRKSMRDPDSTVFEVMGVNTSATVACAEYRSRNGFGGMNREQVVYANGTLQRGTKALIAKHCTNLKDYLSAAQ